MESLPKDLQAKFIRVQDLIEKHGPFEVGIPYVKPLRDGLWALRLRGKSGIARSIYVLVKKKELIILHTFIKKGQKTPKYAMDMAFKRLKGMNT